MKTVTLTSKTKWIKNTHDTIVNWTCNTRNDKIMDQSPIMLLVDVAFKNKT